MKYVNDTTVHKNVKRIGLGPSKARTRNIVNRIYYLLMNNLLFIPDSRHRLFSIATEDYVTEGVFRLISEIFLLKYIYFSHTTEDIISYFFMKRKE